MPVQFVLGRAGSGKTEYCRQRLFEELKKNPLGPRIYYILPRQATFEAERELTCRLGAFSRVSPVSFDHLVTELFNECGSVDLPPVTSTGRRMLIGMLLRKHKDQLTVYSSSAHRPGLAEELASTFKEMDRAGIDSDSVGRIIAELAAGRQRDELLNDKLHDLHLLLKAYTEYLGQERLDPHRRLKMVLKRIADCGNFSESLLVVDDFFEFTEFERKVLVALAAVTKQTYVSLLVDPDSAAVSNVHMMPDEMGLFFRTERTYRTLHFALTQARVMISPPVLLRGNHRFANESLQYLERHFLQAPTRDTLASPGDPQAVEFITANNLRGEVDAVARRIREILRQDVRLREIAVLARDSESYREILAASFSEHGLPYFLDRRRSAAHHPLIQFLRSATLIARDGWPHDAVMSLIKSSLAGLSDRETNELENYVIEHRIRGRRWTAEEPWEYNRRSPREDEEAPDSTAPSQAGQMETLRQKLKVPLQPFVSHLTGDSPLTTRSVVEQLYALMEAFKIRQKLSEWMQRDEAEGQLEQQSEHAQLWIELMGLLTQMVDLLGSEPTTIDDFLSVLDSGLEKFDLALTPPTVDQILFGQLDRTRVSNIKFIFILGLNEGQFPRVSHETSVLSDSERRRLGETKCELADGSERQLLNERFLAYYGLTRASQTTIVSRSLSTEAGRAANPSAFWLELSRLFPQGKSESALPTESNSFDSIGTPRQLIAGIMRWIARGDPADADSSTWQDLYQRLVSEFGHTGSRLDALRQRTWGALLYKNAAAITTDIATRLYPAPLQATVARLETFATCPFRHFAKYGLRLTAREDPNLSGLDLHHAYHHILENLLRGLLRNRQDWSTLDPQAAAALIRKYALIIGKTLRSELMLSTARNRYLLQRVERTLSLALEAQKEMQVRGHFRSGHAGVRFGAGGILPPYRVTTNKGAQLDLSGKIDRVDLHERDNQFVVVDYKMGVSPLQFDRVYHGLSLQLLTYLLVIQVNGQTLGGTDLQPAAAFYLQLLRSHQPVDHPSEAIDPQTDDFRLGPKPRGMVAGPCVTSLDNGLTEGHSRVIQVYVKKDGQFGNRHMSDVADQKEFNAVLLHVEQRLGELADEIYSGDVRVYPYRINRETPCARCEYRAVCRFEPGINSYHNLPAMNRQEVLETLTQGETDE